MEKQLWREPQMTEIQVKMTKVNKIGFSSDYLSPATNNQIVGDIYPNDNDCCS